MKCKLELSQLTWQQRSTKKIRISRTSPTLVVLINSTFTRSFVLAIMLRLRERGWKIIAFISDIGLTVKSHVKALGPVSWKSRKVFASPAESHCKMSNLMITELFYSNVLNINRVLLHTRSFRCIHLSVFRYRLSKIGFTGPKIFRGFRETGPWAYIPTPIYGGHISGIKRIWETIKANIPLHLEILP